MNTDVKARWVAALRSGKYKQAQNQLTNGRGSFCCLGVLCDLYAKEHHVAWFYDLESSDQEELPNAIVLAWSGLPKGMQVSIEGRNAPLFNHNDGTAGIGLPSRTFAEIADAIEKQL